MMFKFPRAPVFLNSKTFTLVALTVALFCVACQERLHHPPAPEGVDPEAVRDRHGIWELKSDEGPYRRWYPDGKLARTGQYVKSQRQGTFRNYALDGKTVTSEGEYLDNWRDGTWNFYDSEGRLYLTIRYAAEPKRVFALFKTQDYGNENGSYERYYPDGSIEEQGEFYSGFYHGPIKRYHRNGRLALEGRFEKDKQVGVWRSFYPGGGPEREENYAAGELDGVLRVYYEAGGLYYSTRYENGKEVGPARIFPPPAS